MTTANDDLQKLMELGHAAFLAFVYKQFGAENLPRFLKPEPEKPNSYGHRETYEDAAQELREIGLVELADIVQAYSQTRRSRFDEFFCDLPRTEANLAQWRMNNEWERKAYEIKKKYPKNYHRELVKAGLWSERRPR